MKRINFIFIALLVLVALTALQMCFMWADRGMIEGTFRSIVASQDEKPFVYRALLPYLSRVVSAVTRLDAVYCMMALFILSAVGFFVSLIYLQTAFDTNLTRAALTTFVGVEGVFALIIVQAKVYDMATAMFFSLSLALLVRRKYWLFYLLYPIATLNRETTFLLTAFYMVYYLAGPISRWHWLYGIAYQGAVYMLIRIVVTTHYDGNPGVPFLWSWRVILEWYFRYWWLTLICIGIAGAVLYIATRRWNEKPRFLRTALLVIFPLQVVLHILMGLPYEVRVFAESAPIIVALSAFPLPTGYGFTRS